MTTDPLRAALAEALRAATRGSWSTPTRKNADAQKAQDERWLRDTADAILAHPAVVAALAGSGPAEGLRELRAYVYEQGAFGLIDRRVSGVIIDRLNALAATPTASPTPPPHVHDWEAWDSTDPNESWFACVSGCNAIVRRRVASPTATGEGE